MNHCRCNYEIAVMTYRDHPSFLMSEATRRAKAILLINLSLIPHPPAHADVMLDNIFFFDLEIFYFIYTTSDKEAFLYKRDTKLEIIILPTGAICGMKEQRCFTLFQLECRSSLRYRHHFQLACNNPGDMYLPTVE